MNMLFITFRSVTPAQRGEQLLRRAGIGCSLQRTPRWMEERGCGYCLQLRRKDMEQAVHLLRQGQVPFRKAYEQFDGGVVEEVEL